MGRVASRNLGMAASEGHHCEEDGPHGGLSFAEAVEEAKARFKRAGVRWTPMRERALELLFEAARPVKAYDLMAEFKAGESTTPPTVYRALDALVDVGLVHRVPSLNAYVACIQRGGGRHTASFLICETCREVEEIAAPTKAVLELVRAQSRFRPAAVVIEVHGRCWRCQGEAVPEKPQSAPPAP
jgi:Fur family zinc uptake transcriptional regulator